MSIQIGDNLIQNYVIKSEDLISDIDSNLPDVLGTYIIVKWAEITAGKLLLNYIESNQLSVGIRVDIKHADLALINQTVQISCVVSATKGNLINFEIDVSCEGDIIATVKHTRALVSINSFKEKIKSKNQN